MSQITLKWTNGPPSLALFSVDTVLVVRRINSDVLGDPGTFFDGIKLSVMEQRHGCWIAIRMPIQLEPNHETACNSSELSLRSFFSKIMICNIKLRPCRA